MGISPSITLAKPFADITILWPKGKYDAVLKAFKSFKFDYVVEGGDVQKFFNSNPQNALTFVESLSFYYTGIINTDLFMITIILLYEMELQEEKISRIFDFIDTNKDGLLTYNEMMFLMMRLGESLACITGQRQQYMTIHGPLVQYVKYVYASLGKMYTDKISREELVNWVKYDLFDAGCVLFDQIFAHITTLRPEYDRVINYGPLDSGGNRVKRVQRQSTTELELEAIVSAATAVAASASSAESLVSNAVPFASPTEDSSSNDEGDLSLS